jgi:hypothetical protein
MQCENCSSDRITQITTYQAIEEINVKTGKVLRKEKSWNNGAPVFWSYKCRKCGWVSETYTE